MRVERGAPEAVADRVTPLPGRWLLALQAGVCLTLAARGWLTWRWDSPLRTLVWQEGWWTNLLNRGFGVSWNEFARHSEPTLTRTLEAIGIGLMICAIVPCLATRDSLRWTRWLLVPAGLVLALDAFARWVEVDWQFAMSIEHALQVFTPFALLMILGRAKTRPTWILLTIAAISLTFVGHGLYALGFHAVPLNFQTMTMKLLGCEQETALLFLRIVGWLDLVAVVGLWFPTTRRWALFYMIAWGAATALARPLAYGSLDPWLAEMLVRTPHWLFPLLLFFGLSKNATGESRERLNPEPA